MTAGAKIRTGKVKSSYERGAGMYLSDGSPELLVNPAQLKSNNPNLVVEWMLEVIE